MNVYDVPFLMNRKASLVLLYCLVIFLTGFVTSVGAQDITSPTISILNPENDDIITNPSADLEFSLDDENPMTVWIYGGRSTSTLQLLHRQEDVSSSTIIFPWSTPALEPEPSTTRGLWSFDELTGTTIADGSENSNTGTFIGEVDPLWIEDGRFGPALDFDGLDDYVVIPDDPSLDIDPTTGAITVEAWVYPDDAGTGTWRTILAKRAMASSPTNYQLTIHQTTGTLLFYNGTTIFTSDMAVPAGEWSYIAVTWDAADKRMHFYRNGVEEDYIDNVNMGPANDADLFIGVSSQIGTQTFDGIIDEVRISGRALDADEVAANYTMADDSYYWQVVAEDAAANSTSSEIHYFSIATAPDIDPPQITLLAPDNMSNPGGNQVAFSAIASDISPMTIELYADTTADPTNLLNEWEGVTGFVDPFEFGCTWDVRQLPVLPDYTVGLWHFNENAGLLVFDESPYENDGGTSGYPGWESQGRFHSAIDFDGSNDYVTINDDASLDIDSATGEFTLEAWIYPHISGGNHWQGIISKRPLVSGDYNCNYQLSIDGATGNLMYYASGIDWAQSYVSDVNIPADEWSYIAVTLKASEGVLRFYRNGEELDAIEDAVIGKSHQYPLFIGISGRYLECFDGLIDEVRISKKALPASAIAKNYVLPFGTYNWKVVATDSNTNQITSEIRSFTIEDVTAPDLYLAYPSDAGVFYDPYVELGIDLWDESAMNIKVYGGRDTDPINLLYAVDGFMGDEILLDWNSTPLDPVNGETMGLWHMDENSGAATADAGEAANSGTLMGDPVWTTAGHFGYALEFDGADDYITVPDDPSLDIDSATGALTIEAWIYPEHLDDGVTQTILAKRGFGSSLVNYQLSCDAATGALFLYSGNYATYMSDVIVPENQWSYIAVTLNGADEIARFYLNGELLDTIEGATFGAANAEELTIGTANSLAECFDGKIDELRLTSRELGEIEIASNYYLSSGTWYWKVVAEDDSHNSATSEVRYFDIVIAPEVTLYEPQNGTVIFGSAAHMDASVWDESPLTVKVYGDTMPDPTALLYVGENITTPGFACDWTAPVLIPEPGATIGLWNFDDGSGLTITDQSGNNLDGQYMGNSGDLNWTTAGKFAYDLDFNGTTDYVVVPDDPALDIDNTTGALTMEAWIYPHDAGTGIWRTILAKRDMASSFTNYQMTLHQTDGSILFYDGVTIYETSAVVPVDEWSYVAVTLDAVEKVLRVYINGELADAVPNVSFGPPNDADLHIGVSSQLNLQTFDGLIDEVRLTNRILSPTEIASNARLTNGRYYWKVVADDGIAQTISEIRWFDLYNYSPGDANSDAVINIGDAVYIVNYVFKGGPAPVPIEVADANCDGAVNVGDAVYIVNYIFKGGPAPCLTK